MGVERLVGRGVREELDLVELVHAQETAGVASGRTRLAAVAGGGGGEAQGQHRLLEDLAPVHRRQRNLGGRDRPQVVAFEVIGVVGEFRQVTGGCHRLGQHHRRGTDLLVGRRVAVQRESGQRPQQAGAGAPVEGEHGTRETGAPFHVEQLQRLADLPVRDVLVVGSPRFGRTRLLAGPPAAYLDVVGVALPVGNLVGIGMLGR